MTLGRLLREAATDVCRVVEAKGASAVDAARGLDALVETLERGAVDATGATDGQRLVADGVFEWLERHGVAAPVRELRVVHEWALAGVTAHVQRLEAARRDARTEERLRFILPNARIKVAEIDRALCLQWIYDPGHIPKGVEIIGRNIRDLDAPVFAEEIAAIVERVIESGTGERAELSPPSLGPAHLLATFEPTRDESGHITGVLVAATDVTELKETELALARSVAFREQVLAILAHDLKNPLSSVLALATLHGRNEQVPQNVRSALSHIDLASRRMVELINTLVDFSAARFGETLPVARVASDLHDVALGAIDELRPTAPERIVELHAEGDTRGTWDPARMAQVVSNLVGNALTHGAPREPVVVRVEARESRVVLRVANGGPPIDAGVMPLLFEPFRRGGDPHDRPHGLGLGLYIAREIVKAHGGVIDAVSTVERGTIFTVDLPRSV